MVTIQETPGEIAISSSKDGTEVKIKRKEVTMPYIILGTRIQGNKKMNGEGEIIK